MAFDEKKYLKYFEKENLTEEQKLERINIYKNILIHFVDAAFGQTPEQQCLGISQENYLQSPDEEVESKQLSEFFKKKSDPKPGRRKILSRVKNDATRQEFKPN